MKAYLTYALNKEGDLVHIDGVPNGNECECFCPHCMSELCAKNEGVYKYKCVCIRICILCIIVCSKVCMYSNACIIGRSTIDFFYLLN